MSSKPVIKAINDQMAREWAAAYLYLSMTAYFELANLPGFAHWMRLQHREEIAHAMRLFDYLLGKGAPVELQAIERPPSAFKGPLDVAQVALEHEQAVTKAIHDLYELAGKEKDYATQLQLEWFITEQEEEERIFNDLIARLKMAGETGAALLLIDRELAARTAAG